MNLWLTFRPLTKFLPTSSRPPYHLLFDFQPTSDRLPFNPQSTSVQPPTDFRWTFGRLQIDFRLTFCNFRSTSYKLPVDFKFTSYQLSDNPSWTFNWLPINFQKLLVNFLSASYQIPINFHPTSGQLQVKFMSLMVHFETPATCRSWLEMFIFWKHI